MSRPALPTATTTLAALIAVSVHADTLTVPGEYPTIQAAIDASSDGDEIAVSPGVYGSADDNVVDMKGRAVRLYATDGPDVTFIDGNDDDCPADLNGDGEVGGANLTIILSNWGGCGSSGN